MRDDVAAVHARIRALYGEKQRYGSHDDAAERARKSYADADLYDEIADLYALIGDKAQSASSTEMAKAHRNSARVYEEAAADTRVWGKEATRLALQLHAEACALREQGDDEGADRLLAEAMQAALRSTSDGPIVRIGPVYADGVRTSIRLVRQRPPAEMLPRLATCSRPRTHRVRAPRPRRRRSGVVRGARSPGRQDDPDPLPRSRVAPQPLGGRR
jgi:hypothetical protein